MMVAVYAIVTAADHGWASGHTLGFGGAAAILLAAFAAWESRIENPILPLRLLRIRTLIGASVVRGFLVIGMFGSWVLGTLFVEHVLGYGAWDTGLAFLPMTLTVGALSLGTTARVMARLGPERTVVLGMGFVVVALLWLTRAGEGARLLPGAVRPVRADGARHGHGDAAAADDRHERRAGADAGLGLGHPQRLDAARGRARDRRPRHAGGGAHQRAGRRRRERGQRPHRRLPPRVRDRRRRGGGRPR